MLRVDKWDRQQGDDYRKRYSKLSFHEKQEIMDAILQRHHQLPDVPEYLSRCLHKLNRKHQRIVELGGYNGRQALEVLRLNPSYSWVNYDISKVAQQRTLPELQNYNYTFKLLESPIPTLDLRSEFIDVFYTSRMLEHLRFQEVRELLMAVSHARAHVHIVDWWWNDDTHVIEPNYHGHIVTHLKALGYKLINEKVGEWSTKLFMVKRSV